MKIPIDIIRDGYDPNTEIMAFLMFAGKYMAEFLSTKKSRRDVSLYGRLIAICTVFGFRREMFRLFSDGESRIEEILHYIQTAGKDRDLVEGWIKEAIENIEEKELKDMARLLWEDKIKRIDGEFALTKLL